jgi:hypothetical protein
VSHMHDEILTNGFLRVIIIVGRCVQMRIAAGSRE